MLPGESCEAFIQQIRDRVDDAEVEIEPKLAFQSRTSPADTPLFRAIERVAAEREIALYFTEAELCSFEPTISKWTRGVDES